MAKVIAIANQKGGVGKTTTAVNLAAAITKKGYRVLAIDFDPQANLTSYMGLMEEITDAPTIAELMESAARNQALSAHAAIRHEKEGFDLIPAHVGLAEADLYLVPVMSRETVLRRVLQPIIDSYDYILIDCNPSLGLLLTNALVAATDVLVPTQREPFAMAGLGTLLSTINTVKSAINPDLRLLGILYTFATNTSIGKAVDSAMTDAYGDLILNTRIPKRVEAVNGSALHRTSVAGSNDIGRHYEAVAAEIIERSV